MSQTLDLIINAKNSSDAAFKKMQAGLDDVDVKLKKLVPSTDAWSAAQQRASMRMENMHEEALKMNTGLGTTDDKAQRLAGTINTMSSTLTSSAAAMGMPIGQLGALNSAADLAGMGMGKLKTTMVGFNTASFAAAGAGLAVGAAIGTWLRTFPAVAKAADDAAAALYRLFQRQEDLDKQAGATQGMSEWQTKMAASHEAATKKQVESLRAMGMSTTQILDALDSRHKASTQTVIEGLEKQVAAEKKWAEGAKKRVEDHIKLLEKHAKEWSDWLKAENVSIAEQELALKALGEQLLSDQLVNSWKRVDEAAMRAGHTQVTALEMAIALAREEILANILRAEQHVKVMEVLAAEGKVTKEALEEARKALAELKGENSGVWDDLDLDDLANSLAALDDLFDALGVSAGSALREIVAGFAEAAQGAADFLKGLNSGNPAAVISGIAGMVRGLKGAVDELTGGDAEFGFNLIGPHEFTAAERLNHELMVMRTNMINAAGGMDALEIAAARAGVSLDDMWNARTVAEYEAAVGRVNAAIALHESAVDKTKAAMDRWGISIGQMGPAFAQQMLHEGLAEIYQDLQLLMAGGADVAAILAGPMGDAIEEMVQQAAASGAALPEFMRPFIQSLIDSGDLLDENGNKITDISQLEFTETLEAGVQRLIDKIEDLVNALLGIQPIEVGVSYKVNGGIPPGVPGGPPVGGGHHYPPQEDFPPQAEGGWFPYRPGGYPVRVGEEGDEAIIPKEKMAGIIAQAMAMAGGGGGGGPIFLKGDVYLDGQGMRDSYIRWERVGALTRT